MKYIFYFYQRELGIAVLITLLLAWAISSSIIALKAENQVYLIKVEDGQANVITDGEVKADNSILLNFVRRYLLLTFNFDSHTFQDNQEKASDLMSLELFDRSKAQLAKQLKDLEGKYVSQSAEVFRCDQVGAYRFECEVRIWSLKEGKDLEQRLRVVVQTRPAGRSLENPWGYEIKEFASERL